MVVPLLAMCEHANKGDRRCTHAHAHPGAHPGAHHDGHNVCQPQFRLHNRCQLTTKASLMQHLHKTTMLFPCSSDSHALTMYILEQKVLPCWTGWLYMHTIIPAAASIRSQHTGTITSGSSAALGSLQAASVRRYCSSSTIAKPASLYCAMTFVWADSSQKMA